MLKEIIWNIGLLFMGFLVVKLTTLSLKNVVYTNSIIPGRAFSLSINKHLIFKIGGALGVVLILLRYYNLCILAIPNKDVRIFIMTIGYLIPIFLVLVARNTVYNYFVSLQTKKEDKIPIKLFHISLKELRSCGLFHAYKKESDDFITKLAIDRLKSMNESWINFWDSKHGNVNKRELLRLDTEKTWIRYYTEFVLSSNKEYELVIDELKSISEGNFTPENIVETWISKDEVEISFTMNHSYHKLYPKVENDWADMDTILKYINNLMKENDFQFYYAEGGDILIIGLTEKERELLSRLLKIEFGKP